MANTNDTNTADLGERATWVALPHSAMLPGDVVVEFADRVHVIAEGVQQILQFQVGDVARSESGDMTTMDGAEHNRLRRLALAVTSMLAGEAVRLMDWAKHQAASGTAQH